MKIRVLSSEFTVSDSVTGSQRNNSAFTLIELIISASLMTMILVSSYVCLMAGVHGRELVQQRSDVAQTGRVVLNLIAADLRAATPLSQTNAFLGMDRLMGEVEADNLDFATHRYSPERRHEGDWAEVSYYVSQNKESGLNTLYRRRDPTPDPEPLMGGSKEELAVGVMGLRFEYYDGFEWFDEWGDIEGKAQLMEFPDSNMSGMPAAVRITLALDPDPKPLDKGTKSAEGPGITTTNAPLPMVFETVVRLNLSALKWGSGPSGVQGGADEE